MAGDFTSLRTLSKSDFALARTCDAKLYFKENHYADTRGYDPYLRLLSEGGFMVEALACAKRPDGILLEYTRDPVQDCARTLEYLERDEVTLFQATFLWKRRLARIDILEKRGNVIRLLEVKAKSFDGRDHAEKLKDGGLGAFRSSRKPFSILSEWVPKFEEVTFQTLIVERLLPDVRVETSLILVDKSKRSTIDDLPRLFDLVRREDNETTVHAARFIGTDEQLAQLDLLTEVDATAEVALLRDTVDLAATHYEGLLDAPFESVISEQGVKCISCEFRTETPSDRSGFTQCWGELSTVAPHMLELFSIGTVKTADGVPIVESLAREGRASLFDIPEDCLAKKDGTVGPQAERQRRQIQHTRSGERWIGPSLGEKVHALRYPLHFIDFEVSRLALPYHSNMRPYGQVAFQWSCHSVTAPGATPIHIEWLNDAEVWPNLTFASTLRSAIGDTETVIAWSPFESGRLNELVREHTQFGPYDLELVNWVSGVDNRIVDIHDWAKSEFYHPGMRGRTSIKVVLDALWKSDPLMREQFGAWTGSQLSAVQDPYHALPAIVIAGVAQDVREGTGAMRAYEAMMYGVERNDANAKSKWRELLLQYCKLDTLSMVLIFEHWRRLSETP